MIKVFRCFVIILLLLTGCAQQSGQVDQNAIPDEQNTSAKGTLLDQQLAAYPMLEDNAYLTLKSFEAARELEDFNLIRAGGQDTGESRILYSASPTATGTGALGVALGVVDDYTLVLDTPIRRWKAYNLLFFAIFIEDTQASCEVELADSTGKSSRYPFLLTQGWNKLQVDLTLAGRAIDLEKVNRVKFSFYQIGDTKIFLDDLILVDYHKTLLGQENGPAGTIFAIRDGKHIRLGTNGRFEVVFSEGKLIAWYDLGFDRNRTNNLLPAGSQGLELFQVVQGGQFEKLPTGDAMVSAHTQLTSSVEGEMRLTVENYFNTPEAARKPDQTFIYHIYSDGLILVDITTNSEMDRLGVAVAVADDQGFDGVVGKIKNPAGGPESRIEYALFRRMGKKAGADLLVAFKPWEMASKSVQCKIDKSQARFVDDAGIGENVLHGMIRLWPADIDNLGNAEKYIRKFMESSSSGYKEEKSSKPASRWQPSWDLNEL